MSPTTVRVDGGIVTIAVSGRVTAGVIDTMATALDAAVGAGTPFAVLFDRRAMTAPTADGRAALYRWAADEQPRLVGSCLAWADVFDARRAASLERAAAHRDPPDPEPESAERYPQQTFADPDAARRWLRTYLDSDAITQ